MGSISSIVSATTLCTLDTQSLTSGSVVFVFVFVFVVIVVVVDDEHEVALESFQGGNISFCPENRRSTLVGW